MASNFFAKKLYYPLSRIEDKIKDFMENYCCNTNGIDSKKSIEKDAIINNANNKIFGGILELQHLEGFLQKTLKLAQEKHAAEQALVQVASQAAHDICSPVMALDIALKQIPGMTPGQQRCVKNIEKRIADIAKDLMRKYEAIKNKKIRSEIDLDNVKEEFLMPTLIGNLIEIVFEEKSLLFNANKINFTKHIQSGTEEIYVLLNPNLMRRALCNVINNAADAITAKALKP